MSNQHLSRLLSEIRSCRHCEAELPLGARPVLRAAASARILIVGQAPGTKVHATGIPWNDPSGDRLRDWMGLERQTFYDEQKIAIIPMGFCYPGRGRSGDLPPRPECAPLWHERLLSHLPRLDLILLVGAYAVARYMPETKGKKLTDIVRDWRKAPPPFLPLPHPSPRNIGWLKRNPWMESELVPVLRCKVAALLDCAA